MAFLSINEGRPGESAPFLSVFIPSGADAANQLHLFLRDVTPEEMHRLACELEAAQTNHRVALLERDLANSGEAS